MDLSIIVKSYHGIFNWMYNYRQLQYVKKIFFDKPEIGEVNAIKEELRTFAEAIIEDKMQCHFERAITKLQRLGRLPQEEGEEALNVLCEVS